jgi:hypothetical protein
MSAAELSSVSTALEDLARRITGFADQAVADQRDDLASELFEVERALVGASRRLSKLVTSA